MRMNMRCVYLLCFCMECVSCPSVWCVCISLNFITADICSAWWYSLKHHLHRLILHCGVHCHGIDCITMTSSAPILFKFFFLGGGGGGYVGVHLELLCIPTPFPPTHTHDS